MTVGLLADGKVEVDRHGALPDIVTVPGGARGLKTTNVECVPVALSSERIFSLSL